jgi:hypothetical protein
MLTHSKFGYRMSKSDTSLDVRFGMWDEAPWLCYASHIAHRSFGSSGPGEFYDCV